MRERMRGTPMLGQLYNMPFTRLIFHCIWYCTYPAIKAYKLYTLNTYRHHKYVKQKINTLILQSSNRNAKTYHTSQKIIDRTFVDRRSYMHHIHRKTKERRKRKDSRNGPMALRTNQLLFPIPPLNTAETCPTTIFTFEHVFLSITHRRGIVTTQDTTS